MTGLGCAQEMTVFPTYNEYVQAGGKLPGFLYEKARKKWHKKWDVPYEASAAEQDTEASAEYEGGWCEEADVSMCELDWDSEMLSDVYETLSNEADEYEMISDKDGARDLEASMIENLETPEWLCHVPDRRRSEHADLPIAGDPRHGQNKGIEAQVHQHGQGRRLTSTRRRSNRDAVRQRHQRPT